MRKVFILLFSTLIINFYAFSQGNLIKQKNKKFKTSTGIKIDGEIGFLEVPENRKNPSSRKIRLKYVHLKSLSKKTNSPIVYLEGGNGISTWEADSPKDLEDRVPLLKVADLIFLDRRGSNDKVLTYISKEAYPKDFFVSEIIANQHYQNIAKSALKVFHKNNVDISGYTVEEHANDVNDLMTALGYNYFTLFGFSYGSHIGMSVIKMFSNKVEKAIFVGADAPNQAFNFPRYLDHQIRKIGTLISQDDTLNMTAASFNNLVQETILKLRKKPIVVTVKHPLTRKRINLLIGDFGLSLILRLDIDDANDIPIIPRLLHTINNEDYSILTWFIQKRMIFALGISGQSIQQQLSSGASIKRWASIQKEAKESLFGNVVNFPFAAVKDYWPTKKLSFDTTLSLKTNIPTLFITGTLDCRTPVEQVELIMQGFLNASHIQVKNAGHEQAQWNAEVIDEIIPSFLKGKSIPSGFVERKKIKFIQLTGKVSGHPSLK